MKTISAIVVRAGMALVVFGFAAALFVIAVALVAYRLPGFGERRVFEGDTQPRKVDMSSRSLFEMPFGRGMVALDANTELYLPKEGNPWIGQTSPLYHVVISARPLMFGGYADAELLSRSAIYTTPDGIDSK